MYNVSMNHVLVTPFSRLVTVFLCHVFRPVVSSPNFAARSLLSSLSATMHVPVGGPARTGLYRTGSGIQTLSSRSYRKATDMSGSLRK